MATAFDEIVPKYDAQCKSLKYAIEFKEKFL
jgi:hypothetical protein